MELEIYQVDAFTEHTFRGNPAAVCMTQHPLETEVMLNIAAEMAVSETAFLCLADMNLKWFTPKQEVMLCGHGTLATVEVLRHKGKLKSGDVMAFNTLSGVLEAELVGDEIALDFPAPVIETKDKPDFKLVGALGLNSSEINHYAQFDGKQLIAIDSESRLKEIAPNFDALKQLPGRGVVITALSSEQDLDFISRYFAPWVGVNEDPVTGSAHCALTKYWGEKLDKTEFSAYQASERGGHLKTKLIKDRVKLFGSARMVLAGKLYI